MKHNFFCHVDFILFSILGPGANNINFLLNSSYNLNTFWQADMANSGFSPIYHIVSMRKKLQVWPNSDKIDFSRKRGSTSCKLKGETKQKNSLNLCNSFCLISPATNMIDDWDIIHLKSEIHSYVWSTKTFLYDIRELRYKQIKMG